MDWIDWLLVGIAFSAMLGSLIYWVYTSVEQEQTDDEGDDDADGGY